MIYHTVFFKLKSEKGSIEEANFFTKANKLATIKGVEHFKCVHQTSKKNNFDYGLYMEFDSELDYENYNSNVQHVDFVENVWKTNVIDFLEIDYELFP